MLGVKQTQEVPATLPQDEREGVAEEEWVSEGGKEVKECIIGEGGRVGQWRE